MNEVLANTIRHGIRAASMGATLSVDLSDDGRTAVFDFEASESLSFQLNDAMSRDPEPLPEADDEDPYRFLAHDGIDHTTGLDTLFQDHHAGVMLNAGFAMMEIEDE